MKLRVLTIFGTRPEAIKMAPVVKALEKNRDIHSIVAVTAQHRQMLDQVLDLFDIVPDFDLNVMQQNQDLFDVTAKALEGLRDVLVSASPDVVLVHGDTTTCFAGALAAFYKQIPVAHVEAGLRTGNISAPFPEEANRKLVASLARIHFAPTATAKSNLVNEGVPDGNVVITGNTVVDALLDVRDRLSVLPISKWAPAGFDAVMDKVQNCSSRIILITGHRRENFGQGFVDLCQALKSIAIDNPSWLLVYPVHLNPNVQKPVRELLTGIGNILLVEPLEYLPFVWLLNKSDLVITDSGGIQEEAPSLGKPVLVTRELTERPEAVSAGTVRLVGTSSDYLIKNVMEVLNEPAVYKKMSEAHNPYGDGEACARIVSALMDFFYKSRLS